MTKQRYLITDVNLPLHKSMLDDFNKRIDSTGLDFNYNTNHLLRANSIINQEQIILIEDEKYIRCASKIKNQPYFLNGKIINFQDIQIPISESILNNKYLPANLFFLKKISSISKNMHALGMGGINEPLPKILNKLGFDLRPVHFLFTPLKISSLFKIFLQNRNLNFFKFLSLLFKPMDLMILFFYKMKFFKSEKITIKKFDKFDHQDNAIWEKIKNNFYLIAEKKAENLNIIYHSERFNLTKLRLYDGEEYLGWIVLKITSHDGDKYFGHETTCTIVDLCSKPCNYNVIINIIKKTAIENNAGVILMNSLNKTFNYHLKKNFFIKSNSNFAFASKLEDSSVNYDESWITRGDGDGPINL